MTNQIPRLQQLINANLPAGQKHDLNSRISLTGEGTFWVRQFFWHFHGRYRDPLGKSWPFTYDVPVHLPSGNPASIFGFCSPCQVREETCSKPSIKVRNQSTSFHLLPLLLCKEYWLNNEN